MPQSQSYVLRVKGVNYSSKKGKKVLNGISFNVEQGQIVWLFGSCDCSKVTLLRVIAGPLIPINNQLWIDNTDQAYIPTYRRNLGLIFQDSALFPRLPVEENLSSPLRCGKRKPPEPWPGASTEFSILRRIPRAASFSPS